MKRFPIILAAAMAAIVFAAPQTLLAAEKAAKSALSLDIATDDLATLKTLKKDDPRWHLDMAQDNVSMEKKIAAYIALIHKVSARPLLNKKKKDLFLVYELAPPKAPKIPAVVNSMAWARDPKTKEVKARMISVKATYPLPPEAKTDANLDKIRKLTEQYMWRMWSPFRIYITPKKNIRLASFIAYTGSVYKIHPEMVFSLLTRMMNSWGIYYNMLIKEVPEAKARPRPKAQKPQKAK